MKKILIKLIIISMCLIMSIPSFAGDYEKDLSADEPDSTYLDSLKRNPVVDYEKRYQETLEMLQEDARRSVEPYIDDYIYALSDTSKDRRYIAAFELGRSQDKRVIPYLEKLLLEDPASIVRTQCAKALSSLKSIASQPVLIEAMKDSEEEVRLQSALTLASLGDTTYCIPVLEELWKFGDRRTRRFVNRGFKNIGTERAVQNLREAINDDDPYVAGIAAIQLAKLRYFEDAFPSLKKLLKHKDPLIRCGALKGLFYIGDKASLQLIREMLNDEEIRVRNRARKFLTDYNEEVPEEDKQGSMRNYDPRCRGCLC
ncbi:MAG: HEAT repeat domain-containing protein [Candidatus Cloacimonetes bacterium]|nr:HEAT repeat domain-containing protein [Candidatus Cloacimonadota bacterium]